MKIDMTPEEMRAVRAWVNAAVTHIPEAELWRNRVWQQLPEWAKSADGPTYLDDAVTVNPQPYGDTLMRVEP